MVLDERVRSFLDQRRYGVLATVNGDGSPQQTVMWYARRGDQIMMNTKRGRIKDRNMVRDERISLCVEDGQRFVTVSGTISMVEDQAVAQADIKALAVRYEGAARAEELSRDAFGKQERITLILAVDRVMTHGFDDEG